jgi:hypothetical protein
VAAFELDNTNVLKSEAYNAIGNHAGGADNLSELMDQIRHPAW